MYTLTELGINVPFIVNAPGMITRGGERDTLINAADILPTLADLASADLPEGVTIDGRSFAMTLHDEPTEDFDRGWTFTQYSKSRVVRGERFKLNSEGGFFDLASDPLELRDLAANKTPLSEDVAAARKQLQGVLDSLPPDAEWPYVFRSISARKIRAAEDAKRRADWIQEARSAPRDLASFFSPPLGYVGEMGAYRSPLMFEDGTRVKNASDWQRRREEILTRWHGEMGRWPDLIAAPRFEAGPITRRDNITQRRLKIGLELGGGMVDAFMLVPDGDGPFPAVLTVFYDAQTGVGYGREHRDFAWGLAQRGFVTLSIGKPNSGINLENPDKVPNGRARYFGPDGAEVTVQPLSALAYAAANAHTFLANRPEVYPDRIGIVGHSFGGKWGLFASCLYDKFDCAVWSDPGIVFDERDRRKENPGGSVNYWDTWYLGAEGGTTTDLNKDIRFRKLPGEGQARTGAYKRLVEGGHDLVELHALMAPRPFMVSGGTADPPERWVALNHAIEVNRLLGYDHRVAMTIRDTHSPTAESNQQIYRFFEWWLMEGD
jgi:dienelactone hydrolase